MKKSTIAALLLLVMLLTITAASAAETNDTSDLSIPDEEGAAVEQADSPAVDDLLTADNTAEVLTAGEGTFTELQSDINASGGSVSLAKDYVRVDGEQSISITKSVMITGNNHVIDASNFGTIFNITSEGSLFLRDVILKNGNADEGGAIYNDGALMIQGCKFFNNTALNRGGAIYNIGSLTLLEGCTFDGNVIANQSDESHGGAVLYSNSTKTTPLISGCIITNNMKDIPHRGGTGGYSGSLITGAITSLNSLSIEGTRFENNSGQNGGAVFFTGDELSISGSTFIDNFAFYGGAIYFDGGSADIMNSTFKRNNAKGTGDSKEDCSRGGALFSAQTSAQATDLKVKNSIFEDNGAAIGGAIEADYVTIINSNFTGNVADADYAESFNGEPNSWGGDGDAIYSMFDSSISKSNFVNNGLFVSDSSIDNSSFSNSVIEVYSGSLYVSNNDYDNEDCDIMGNNNSDVYLDCKGDIPKIVDADIYLTATTFTDLQAFVNSYSTATVHLTTGIYKTVLEQDNFVEGIIIDSPITIDGCGNEIGAAIGKMFTVTENGSLTLLNTTITGYGNGFIVNNGKITLDANQPNTFDDVNYVIENDGVVCQENMATFTHLNNLIAIVNGGEISLGSSKIREEEDEASERGIVVNRTIKISGADSNASISAGSYGRIFTVMDGGVLTLDNIILTDGDCSYGGAVRVYENSYFIAKNVNFVNNSAYNGGAILSEGDVYIIYSTFNNNTCGDGGSAVYNEGTLYVYASNFTNNKGKIGISPDNGAILTFNNATIENCYFTNNWGRFGGAITSSLSETSGMFTLTVKNSIFEGNVGADGGAIYVESSVLDMTNCTFVNNAATLDGGVIYVSSGAQATITDSNFTNNAVLNDGGAIAFNQSANSVIDNCEFISNVAGANGGAIIIIPSEEEATVTVKNSKFDNNDANKGYAIFNQGILALSGNTVAARDSGVIAEITNGESGYITSGLTSVVLGSTTITVDDYNVTLTATLVDDKGNFIEDASFRFIVNGVEVNATFNNETNLYEANYTLPDLNIYTVSMVSNNTNVDVRTGTIRFITGSFTDLYDVIKSQESSMMVTLPYDFKYNENIDGGKFIEGIEIKKDMVINGNGHTIDGANSRRIFSIEGTNFLILNDIVLANGNADYGGAIKVAPNTRVQINSVDFINNTAVYYGGAIYSQGNISIDRSRFDRNDISLRSVKDSDVSGGAAIYNDYGILSISNSDITNNIKNFNAREGVLGDFLLGAITTYGETLIDDCYFANNTGCWGGAVTVGYDADINDRVVIKDSEFDGNNATFGGAVLIHSPNVEIDNCVFENNRGVGFTEDLSNHGGAVYVLLGSILNVTDSKFIANSAVNGGAIASISSQVSIDNCTFTANDATNGGGAVYDVISLLNISNSQFSGNTAVVGNAILNNGFLSLSNNTVNALNADIVNDEGAIYSEINIVVLNGDPSDPVTFNGEILLTAEIRDDNNNMIDDKYFKFVVNETVLDAVFNKTSGLYEANYTNDVPGIYDVNMTYLVNEKLVIRTAKIRNIRSTFTDLAQLINSDSNVELPYDFAYFEEIDGDAFRDGIVIDRVKEINGKGYTIDAKNANRIFNVTSPAGGLAIFSLINVTLANGAADVGAAVYNEGLLYVLNAKFINNTAATIGGAIYSEGMLNIYDAVFDGNDISQCDSTGNGGAAIYNVGELMTLVNVTVTNNHDSRSFDDFTSGAIVTSGQARIKNSYFANNTGCYGGAVFAITATDLDITNSTFENNLATYGGAVLGLSSSELTITNCTFEYNNALYGGAVAAYLESEVNIIGSIFTNNSATYGGAVSLVLIAESDIENCTFTRNIAGIDGGALFILAEVDVKDSVFTDNMANGKGNAIYNNGTLFLSNNTISTTSADIYNDELGVITSNVTATFIDGEIVIVNMGDTVVLNATFVDDMGNAIYDSKFRFNVDDDVVENITYNETTTMYSVEYYVATAGFKEISSNLNYPKIKIVYGYLFVPKANVTLDISAEDIVEGENATIVVHVYGIKGAEMNTTVYVLVNNTLYEVNVTNSYGNLTVSGLEAGSQAIFVNFRGDKNYNENYNSSTFYVKFVTNLNVTVDPTYNYGDDAFIILELYDSHGNPVTGVVNLTVDGESSNILINDGIGYHSVYDLVNGTHTITAVFEGNTHLNGTVNVTSFKVKKLTSFNVTISGTYPEATIQIKGEPGEYLVYIDENHIYNMTVDFAAMKTINIAAGDYLALVTCIPEDGEYSVATEWVFFTVEQAKPEMKVNITDNIEVGQEGVQINVTMAENATGTLIVKIDGQSIEVGGFPIEGKATINVAPKYLTEGPHSYEVIYSGDGNYTGDEFAGTFSAKYYTELTVTVDPTVYNYGEPVEVILTLTENQGKLLTTTVNVTINGKSQTVLIEDGKATLTLTDLESGNYNVTAVLDESIIYNGSVSNEAKFTVKKVPEFTVYVSGQYPFAIVLVSGQSGNYTIYVDDEHSVDRNITGFDIEEFFNLAAGEYNLTVTFKGNDEYSAATVVKPFTVLQADPAMKVNITDNIEVGQEGVQINVTMAENATGTLIVKIDGQSIEVGGFPIEGKATINVAPKYLTEGSHSFEVIYSGDRNYTGDEFSGAFSAKYYTDLSVTVDPAVYNYGETVEVILNLAENQGKLLTTIVNVTINGKSQNVLIEDGKATLTLTDLEPGVYTVSAVLDESLIYNGSVSNVAEFKVKDKSDFDVQISGEYPTATVKILGEPGNYTIYIDDEHSADVTIVNGEYIEEFTNLAAGKYNVTVTFKGNDRDSALTKVVPFIVEKADPNIGATITENIEVGQEGVQIAVTMADNVTGIVSIYIDDQPMTIGGSASSSFTVNVPSGFLTAGNHTFIVKYDGDRNYTPGSLPVTFTVHKITPTVSVTVDKEGLGVMGASNVTVYVADDATGRVIIDYDGDEIIIANLGEAGNFTFDIYDLQAGEYYVNVTYEGDDKYNEAYGYLEFTVPKANATPVISEVTGNILGGENVTFTVEMSNDFATGDLTIFVDGVPTLTIEISEDGPTAVSVPGLGNGTHTIGVKYDGDDNFNESDIVNFTVSVAKANSTVTINVPVNETFDDRMVIEFTVVNQTELIFIVVDQNGTGYMGEIIDGKYVLTGLPVGNYTVNVTNIENDMFNPSSANATFAILKFDFVVDFPVNTSSTEISIKTPVDAGGLLLVDIDGQQHYAPVENGTATVVIPKLAPGNYTATISYTGDGKYGNQTTTKEISIPSNLPENAIDIPTYSETNSPTFSINLPEDAKGTFSVVVDGKEYGAILDKGKASITVPNLPSGDYKVAVSYSGDDKYSSYSAETVLKIHIPVYKISNNKDVSVLYSATKSYSVLVTKDGKPAVDEQVTIKYNGKTYTVKTDSKGYATLKLNTKIKVKTYTLTVECKGVKVSNNYKVKNIIKIKNIKAKKTKKVIKIKATLKKVNGKYLKGKKLTLKVKGMTFKAKTNKKGVAVFKLKRKAIKQLAKTKKYTYSVTNNMKVTVKVPKYTYKVTYGKDVAKKKITVK